MSYDTERMIDLDEADDVRRGFHERFEAWLDAYRRQPIGRTVYRKETVDANELRHEASD